MSLLERASSLVESAVDLNKAKQICDQTQVVPWWLLKSDIGFRMSCADSVSTMTLTFVLVFTLYSMYNIYNRSKRKAVEDQLKRALQTVMDLEEKLMSLEANDRDTIRQTGKEIRIWMDGAFDMMHFGHMNAFRQARALGTYLIAGVNSSETIAAAKGAPVCSDEERCATVGGCKWVDEVVSGVPYVMTDAYLMEVIKKHKIDYVVHGDDPCIVDGKDVYEGAKNMGKYLTIPRTEGVSTTDIVGRMLLLTKDHHTATPVNRLSDASLSDISAEGRISRSGSGIFGTVQVNSPVLASDRESAVPYFRKSNFLATSRMVRLFGAGVKAPRVGDRVVYLAGGWDMFHAGHIATLEKARKLGDYVIVGVHSDSEVNRRRGLNYPILSLHERVLSVLGCKWVDDVLIDAPFCITEDMIKSLKISVVVEGAHTSSLTPPSSFSAPATDGDASPRTPTSLRTGGGLVIDMHSPDETDPYAVAKRMGILHFVPQTHELSVEDYVGRIHLQKEHFDKKFAKKAAAENAFWEAKHAASVSAATGEGI